jgi:putative nucleotidyltransferase with HDIG domain
MTFQNGRRGADYGRGEHSIDEELVDGQALIQELRRLFGSPNYRPPVLPAIAMQVHLLTKRVDTSISEIVELVRKDALLAADVLRRAQSPLYAAKIPPRTLEDASLRIGKRGLRDLVFDVALSSKVFRVRGLDAPMEALRTHSLAVAACAREVAQLTSVGEDSAFLCGLLHDVGLAACLHALAELGGGRTNIDLDSVRDALREVHVEAGSHLVKLWKLPEDIQLVIGAHHAPNIGGYVHPTAACVVLGEEIALLVQERDSPIAALDLHSKKAVEESKGALGVSQSDLDKVVVKLKSRDRLRRSTRPP